MSYQLDRGLIPKELCGHSDRDAIPAGLDVATGEISAPRSAQRLRRYTLRDAAGELLPEFGVARCGCAPLPGRVGVEVRVNAGNVSYSGLRMCGSVWTCPVCAGRITQRRAEELEQAISTHLARGGQIAFITYTVPHLRRDELGQLMRGFGRARRNLKAQRAYKQCMADWRAIGEVYGLEITYGRNGWHPHAHQLLFIGDGASAEEIKAGLFPLWAAEVARAGLGVAVVEAFGVELVNSVEDVAEVARYVAKGAEGKRWSVADEMARTPAKIAASGGASPFELLRIYHEADHAAASAAGITPDRAGLLFVEYAEATRGMAALRWTKGLRDQLGLGAERTDQELAEQAGEGELLGVIPLADWVRVVRAGLRGDLLEIARLDGWQGVTAVLAYLRPPPN